MKLTPEQMRKRQERSARERTFPKCRCGNVLGTERVKAGIGHCRACLSDDQIERREIFESTLPALDKVSILIEAVEDENARLALRAMLQLIGEK